MPPLAEQIRKILEQGLSPARLEITDDSAAHAGHPEARRSGGGHLSVCVVAEAFKGMTRLERHRLVHRLLKGRIGTAVHALALRTLAPDEPSRPDQVRNL